MHLVLRPENPCQTCDPRAKFRVLYRIELKVGGSAVRAPRPSAQLAGSASVLVRVCPLTPTRCNPGAFGFKTRKSVSNLGPPGQISCLTSYRTQSWRVRRSSPRPRPIEAGGSASVLVRVCPLTPTRCNPVAFAFKTRESVSNLGPPGQISCLTSYRTQSWRVRRSSPRPRPN